MFTWSSREGSALTPPGDRGREADQVAQPGQLGVEELGATAAADDDHALVTHRSDRDQVVAERLHLQPRARLEVDHRGCALAGVLDPETVLDRLDPRRPLAAERHGQQLD